MPQWRNQSSREAYPFKPGLPRSSGSGIVSDGDFLDFFAVVEGPVWLRSLETSSGGYRGEFESRSGETLSFEGADYSGGEVELVSSLGGVRGVVVLGKEDLFSRLPAGTHLFPEGLVEVLGTLTAPPPPGVTAISTPDGERAFGFVRLETGPGITLDHLESGGTYQLRIHADGAISHGDCGPGVKIKTINSVPPGEGGGLLLSGSSAEVPESDSGPRQIFRVLPASNGIRIQLVDPNV